MSKRLHRYMSFPEFVNMVQSKQLHLVDPLKWEDKYEGYLFRMLKSEKGKQKILEASKKYTNDEEKVIEVLENKVPKVRCQCWTEKYNDILMWNLYSYNNEAIMVSVKRKSLEELDEIELIDIEYDPEDTDIDSEIHKIIHDDGIYFREVFKYKRNIFGYENEVRMIAKTSTYDKLTNTQKTYPVKLGDMGTFVENVLVHPAAPDWYVNTVKIFCEAHGVEFGGRSDIYELR